MADIVSINKIIDDNYISHDGTRLSKILEDTGWKSLDDNYSNVYYRKIGDLLFLRGAVTPAGSTVVMNLPDCTTLCQYVFLLGGSGSYYTKAWTSTNGNTISIGSGTGTTTTSYNLNVVFFVNNN